MFYKLKDMKNIIFYKIKKNIILYKIKEKKTSTTYSGPLTYF